MTEIKVVQLLLAKVILICTDQLEFLANKIPSWSLKKSLTMEIFAENVTGMNDGFVTIISNTVKAIALVTSLLFCLFLLFTDYS